MTRRSLETRTSGTRAKGIPKLRMTWLKVRGPECEKADRTDRLVIEAAVQLPRILVP
jgi:hypothetical protein